MANFFIIINICYLPVMLPDFGVPDDWIKAAPPPIQIRRMSSVKVLELMDLEPASAGIFNFWQSGDFGNPKFAPAHSPLSTLFHPSGALALFCLVRRKS
jgi:hypothetical protein